MSTPARVARGVAIAVLGLLLVLSGIGLVFLARRPTHSWPGPRVVDALPLGELPHFDRVPLLSFVLVWLLIAGALAVLARAWRLERLTAAATLSLFVGLVLYFANALSLFFVRQLSAVSALAAAQDIRAIYIPALLAGVAGAIAGMRRRESAVAPRLLALLVGAAGLLGVVSAVTPAKQHRLDLIQRFAPGIFPPLANAAVAAAGLMLILTARGLARRKRRAWVAAVSLLSASAIFHLLKGLDFEEFLIVALIAMALLARRHDFNRLGDKMSTRRALARIAIFGTAIYTYGIGALLIRHLAAGHGTFSVLHAVAITTRALVSPHLPAADHLRDWFPLSLALIAVAGLTAVVSAWYAPWRILMWETGAQRARARMLVRRWGSDSLAPFTLRADKQLFFDGAEESFLAYSVSGGVAFISGDPVGMPEEFPRLVRAFLDFAGARGWQTTVLGASSHHLSVYRDLGLRHLYWGDEAVIDTGSFSLDGRAIRKTRQSTHRLERAGFTAEVRWASNVPLALAERLLEIERAWLGDKQQRGTTMRIDDLFHLRGHEALFVIGRNVEGEPCGFLHIATCRAGSMLSLSSMPRLAFTPNGFNEWLVVNAVEWARANGYAHLSLNFSPFARVFSDEEATGMRRLTREALLVVKSRLQLQLDNLYLFNQKFLPEWRPRYIVYQRHLDLPRIGVAALAAEGYLRRRAAV